MSIPPTLLSIIKSMMPHHVRPRRPQAPSPQCDVRNESSNPNPAALADLESGSSQGEDQTIHDYVDDDDGDDGGLLSILLEESEGTPPADEKIDGEYWTLSSSSSSGGATASFEMTTRAQLADVLSKFDEIQAAFEAVAGKGEGAEDLPARTISQRLYDLLFYGSFLVVGGWFVDYAKESKLLFSVAVITTIWGLADR